MRTQIGFTMTNSSEQDAKKSIPSKRFILWPSEQPLDTIQMKKKISVQPSQTNTESLLKIYIF